MIDLEMDKAKQAKLKEAEALERHAQQTTLLLENTKRDAEHLRREAEIAGKDAALKATTVLINDLENEDQPAGTLNNSFMGNIQPTIHSGMLPQGSVSTAPGTSNQNENSSDTHWSRTSMDDNQKLYEYLFTNRLGLAHR